MAICLFCSQKYNKVGELCQSCGNAYTVQDNHGEDSLNLLGKLIVNKFILVSVLFETETNIAYEAFQPAVDRLVTVVVINPKFINAGQNKAKVQQVIDRCSIINQQNSLNLLEVIELPELKTIAVTYEALKGEMIDEHVRNHVQDPVAYMHIIHQLLQAIAAHHSKNINFPHISQRNVRIFRSGSDNYFVKVSGLLGISLDYINEAPSFQDDVYYVGQLALALITGTPLPITKVELPPENSFLMPIAQLFMRTLAPKEQRFESCVELLQAFEIAFDLNQSHEQEAPALVSTKSSANKRAIPKHTPIPFDQIIWMHRPPEAI